MWTREQCLHQTAGVGGDIGPRPRRPKRPGSRRKEEGRSNSVDSGSSEDPADPRRKSSPMVITASLTIPMSGAFTLNLDDPDIPYIEETPKQPSAPPRRQRQRSISGCSEGMTFLNSITVRGTFYVKSELLKSVVLFVLALSEYRSLCLSNQSFKTTSDIVTTDLVKWKRINRTSKISFLQTWETCW